MSPAFPRSCDLANGVHGFFRLDTPFFLRWFAQSDYSPSVFFPFLHCQGTVCYLFILPTIDRMVASFFCFLSPEWHGFLISSFYSGHPALLMRALSCKAMFALPS
jgi:hypothetical protein